MNISYQLLSWRKKELQGLQEISEAGFRFIEVGSAFLLQYENKLEMWEYLLQEFNLQVSSVFELGHFENWTRRREIYLHHDRLARVLHKMRIPIVILGPGVRYSREANLHYHNRMVKMISEVIKRYHNYGIQTAIHPHIGSNIFTKKDINRILEGINTPLFLSIDILHTLEAEIEIFPFLKNNMEQIISLHLKDVDYNHSSGQPYLSKNYKCCDLGEGKINFSQMEQILQQKNYQGWITIEIENSKKSPLESVNHSFNYLKSLNWIP